MYNGVPQAVSLCFNDTPSFASPKSYRNSIRKQQLQMLDWKGGPNRQFDVTVLCEEYVGRLEVPA